MHTSFLVFDHIGTCYCCIDHYIHCYVSYPCGEKQKNPSCRTVPADRDYRWLSEHSGRDREKYQIGTH